MVPMAMAMVLMVSSIDFNRVINRGEIGIDRRSTDRNRFIASIAFIGT